MSKKSIEFYAAVAEVLSALAVIITLLYAVSEYNKSEILENSDIQEILNERLATYNHILIENKDFATVYYNVKSGEEVTPVERMQFLVFRENFYDMWLVAFGSHEEGIFENRFYEPWDTYFKRKIKEYPVWTWTENRNNFADTDFVIYMDELHEKLEEDQK